MDTSTSVLRRLFGDHKRDQSASLPGSFVSFPTNSYPNLSLEGVQFNNDELNPNQLDDMCMVNGEGVKIYRKKW